MLNNKKILPRIIIITVATIAVIIAAIFIVSTSIKSNAYNKALQKANDYLANLEYDSAIASYKTAIEINPNNVEAYLGLADAYIGLEDYDSAVSVLNDGLAVLPDNAELTSKAAEIQTLVDAKIAEEQKLAEYEEELAKEKQEISDEAQESSEDENTSEETIDLENAKWVLVKSVYTEGYLSYETTYEYDEKLNLIKSIRDDEYCEEYEYDDDGNQIAGSFYDSNSDMCTYGYSSTEYNTLQQAVKYSIQYYNLWNDPSDSYCYTYEYDENGNLVKESNVMPSDYTDIFYYIVYEYDDDKLIKGTSVNGRYGDYIPWGSFECKYNEYGDLVTKTYYTGDTSIYCTYTYEYDEYGNKIKENGYYMNTDNTFSTTYEYELIQISEDEQEDSEGYDSDDITNNESEDSNAYDSDNIAEPGTKFNIDLNGDGIAEDIKLSIIADETTDTRGRCIYYRYGLSVNDNMIDVYDFIADTVEPYDPYSWGSGQHIYKEKDEESKGTPDMRLMITDIDPFDNFKEIIVFYPEVFSSYSDEGVEQNNDAVIVLRYDDGFYLYNIVDSNMREYNHLIWNTPYSMDYNGLLRLFSRDENGYLYFNGVSLYEQSSYLSDALNAG